MHVSSPQFSKIFGLVLAVKSRIERPEWQSRNTKITTVSSPSRYPIICFRVYHAHCQGMHSEYLPPGQVQALPCGEWGWLPGHCLCKSDGLHGYGNLPALEASRLGLKPSDVREEHQLENRCVRASQSRDCHGMLVAAYSQDEWYTYNYYNIQGYTVLYYSILD